MYQSSEYKEKQNISLLNTVFNILLAAAKFITGILYKSGAVLSDGVNSLTDALTNIIIIVGTKLAHAPPDDDHNYGHEKIESIISLLLGLAMFFVGGALIYNAAETLITRNILTTFSPVLAIVSAVSIICKEFMYRRTMRCAKKYNSGVLRADAWNYRADSISSLAVLIGVVLGMINPALNYFEPIATIFVGVLILKVAFSIVMSSINQLIDRAADGAVVENITQAILSVPGVIRIDNFKSRISTYKIFVDAEIAVDGSVTLYKAHDIAEAVHHLLEKEYREFNIKHIHVHVNPFP